MEFISIIDFVNKYLGNKKIRLLYKIIFNNYLNNINKFLIKVYSKKLFQQYLQKDITKEQLISQLTEYLSSLLSSMEIGKRVYEILSEEDIVESLDFVFGKSIVSLTIFSKESSSLIKK